MCDKCAELDKKIDHSLVSKADFSCFSGYRKNRMAGSRPEAELWAPIHRTKICVFSFRQRFRSVRIALTVAASAALSIALNGHAEANKTCISKATEALPHLAGLVIKKSRTRPVPAAILASWKGQSQPIMIDLDVVAAGEAQTFSYMCVVTRRSAFVQRTMN